MKFQSYQDYFLANTDVPYSKDAEEAWKLCDSQWRSFLEQEYSMKSFAEWFAPTFGVSEDAESIEKRMYALGAWDFQEKQWRHVLANKMMAIEFQKKKIEHLEKQIEEMRRDLDFCTGNWEWDEDEKEDEIKFQEIRQRHKLDEMKA